MARLLARLLHRLAHVPVLGTAMFVVSDTFILLAVAILDPWLARILLYKILHGQHGRRTELRTGLDFYRYIEYPRVMEWLNRIRPKRTLDIGSNYGLVWQWAAARGIETHATDICDITLTDARAAAPQRVRDRSPISMHNATRLGFKPGSFDAVTVISTIEHIENDRAALDEIANVLEPGGYAILTFPVNREFLEIRDNPSFPLIRLYDLDAIETRLLANDQLVNEHIELWCIRDRFAAKPLWALTRLSDVLRRFVYYRRPKPPFSPEKVTPNILGHHLCVLVLRRTI